MPPPEPAETTESSSTETEAAVPAQGLRHAARAFRHRDFTIFWLGALASNTGSWVQNLAVPFVLYQITKSAFWVGLSTFTQFLPVMLLGPLAGSVADRFDRRRVLLVTQSLMALGAMALWAVWAGGVRSPLAILAVVAVSGVFAGINIPSWQSFVNDLVPRKDLLSAVTLNSLQFNAARALGPGIAGILLASLGASWAFFLNGVSFLFVLGALLLVRNRQPARTSALTGGFLRQFRRAMAYTRQQPGILIGIVVAVLVGALGNPVFQFTVVFAAEVYKVGPLGLSLLNVTLGLGAVLAAPLVSGWDAIFTRAVLVRWGLVTYGLAIVAFAIAPVYLIGLLALVVVGGGFLVVISATNTSVQVIVADHMRGRVMALRIMAFTGAYPVGALLQGSLSDVIGPRPTVAGSGVILVLAGIWLASRPALLHRLDDAHDESVGADGD
ncbi:MAG TPA: MFS transporter [Acidimicrobiales bacterium]|nr:MFS transporter [Acidimicrobiales bacterium]